MQPPAQSCRRPVGGVDAPDPSPCDRSAAAPRRTRLRTRAVRGLPSQARRAAPDEQRALPDPGLPPRCLARQPGTALQAALAGRHRRGPGGCDARDGRTLRPHRSRTARIRAQAAGYPPARQAQLLRGGRVPGLPRQRPVGPCAPGGRTSVPNAAQGPSVLRRQQARDALWRRAPLCRPGRHQGVRRRRGARHPGFAAL